MNPVIKELATQAGFYFDEYNQATQRKVELLAHLIVERCISQIAVIGIGSKEISWCVEKSIESIEQQFGIN